MRQFLRAIKFSSGCSARESHSPPSCEKKEIVFILFSASPSLPSSPLPNTYLTSCNHLFLISITSLPFTFLSFSLAPVWPWPSFNFHLVRGISKTQTSRNHPLRRASWVIYWDYWLLSTPWRKKEMKMKAKRGHSKQAFFGGGSYSGSKTSCSKRSLEGIAFQTC